MNTELVVGIPLGLILLGVFCWYIVAGKGTSKSSQSQSSEKPATKPKSAPKKTSSDDVARTAAIVTVIDTNFL